MKVHSVCVQPIYLFQVEQAFGGQRQRRLRRAVGERCGDVSQSFVAPVAPHSLLVLASQFITSRRRTRTDDVICKQKFKLEVIYFLQYACARETIKFSIPTWPYYFHFQCASSSSLSVFMLRVVRFNCGQIGVASFIALLNCYRQ